jgi:hypothetical protein
MAKNNTTPQHLQKLIAERQRFEQWLAALDGRRASAPQHVLARVEEDYRARLAAIIKELAARAGELRERIGGLEERFTAIQKDEAARRDAKAEAELRAAVGEFTQEQWSASAAETDREIAALAGQRQLLERELAELQQVLAQSAAGEGAPGPAGAAVQPDATRVAPAPSAASPPLRQTSSPPAAAGAVSPPAAAGAVSPPASPAPAGPTAGEVAAAPAARPVRSGKTPAQGTAKQSDGTERRSEKDKTLKCAECGTLNYPTEWYCESCGAELAAL